MIRYIMFALAVSIAFNINNYSEECFAQNNQAIQNQQQAEIPRNIKVLAVSRTNLDTATAKVGDVFQARMVENLIVNQEVIVPSGSIVSGSVTRVIPPRRLNRNGEIRLSINHIQTPQGNIMDLTGNEIQGRVISPYAKSYRERTAERIPVTIASSGTSIPLGDATDLNDGVVYAISQGAAIVAGAVTGFFDPDVGRTRAQTAMRRAYEVTPLGGIQTAVTKGKPADLDSGDGVVLTFDQKTLTKVRTQHYAQLGCPPVVAAR